MDASARPLSSPSLVSLVLLALAPGAALAQGPPDGQLTIAFDASIGLNPLLYMAAPYEEIRLKKQR